LIDAKQEQLKAIRERRDWLVGQVESLLRKSSIEPDAFDLTAWLRDPLGDMLAPAETIKEGGRPWEALKRAVADLEMPFQNDGALPDCLGLPIAEAIAEAAEARRVAVLLEQQRAEARELAAAEARGVRFRAEAMNRLGPEAESWLGARRKTDGVTRFNAAQASDTVFAQLIAALEKAAAERADRISRKQRAEAARRALKERASEALGEGRAAVFVATTHPAIGAHPNDYCVDELTLAECVRLLKPAKPRRR
jgi:hypothetical protein